MDEQGNIWLLSIEHDSGGWCVTTITDGKRRVVSRHPDRESAEAASASINTAGIPARNSADADD